MRVLHLILLFCYACFAKRNKSEEWPKLLLLRQKSSNKLPIHLWDPQKPVDSVKIVVRVCNSLYFGVNQDAGLIFCERDYKIIASSINGSKAEQELCPPFPEDEVTEFLAYDRLSGNLYRSLKSQREREGRIDVLRTREPYAWTSILRAPDFGIRGLHLHARAGWMYWIRLDALRIERAWMDGSHVERVYPGPDHAPPSTIQCLAVDTHRDQLYWWESLDGKFRSHALRRSGLDGSGLEELRLSRDPNDLDFRLAVVGPWLIGLDFSFERLRRVPVGRASDVPQVLHLPFHIEHVQALQEEELEDATGNPCEPSVCSHFCLLVPRAPFFRCRCPNGIALRPDGVSCESAVNGILLSATGGGLTWQSLDVNNSIPVSLGEEITTLPSFIEYDHVQQMIYWIDEESKQIRRMLFNSTHGGSEIVIGADLVEPASIAVDVISRNIYWTDSGSGRIEVARLNGRIRRVLTAEPGFRPKYLQIDPSKGLLFWSSVGEDGSVNITKAGLDCSEPRSLVRIGSGSSSPQSASFALDRVSDLLYWVDSSKSKLMSASSVDGSGMSVVGGGTFAHVKSIFLFGTRIIITKEGIGPIQSFNITSGALQTIANNNFYENIQSIEIRQRHVDSKSNPCGLHNGGCSGLCLYRPSGPVCTCGQGAELRADGRTCFSPSQFLLMTQSGKASLTRASLSPVPGRLSSVLLGGATEPHTFDVDVASRRLIWSDHGARPSIRASGLNSTASETLFALLGNVEGLAVDWAAAHVYWSNSEAATIEVGRLDGLGRALVIWDTVSPRSVAVNPREGFLYWADWASSTQPPAIHRAELSGANALPLIQTTGYVYSISLDIAEGRLYWSEFKDYTKHYAIFSSDMHGGSKRHIQSSSNALRSLSFFSHKLFVSVSIAGNESETRGQVAVIDLAEPKLRPFLDVSGEDVLELKVIDLASQKERNPCSGPRNGGCNSLCFAVPSHGLGGGGKLRVQCGCSHGFALEPLLGSACLPRPDFLLLSSPTATLRWPLRRSQYDLSVRAKAAAPAPVAELLNHTAYNAHLAVFYWLREGRLFVASERPYPVSGEEVALGLSCSGERLSFEPATQQLFVSCLGSPRLQVLRVKSPSLLVHAAWVGLDEGTVVGALDVATDSSLVYVNIAAKEIRKCGLDGRGCLRIYRDRDVGASTDVVFHPQAKAVFWTSKRGVEMASTGPFQQMNKPFYAMPELDTDKEAHRLAIHKNMLFVLVRNVKRQSSEVLVTEVEPAKPGQVVYNAWSSLLKQQHFYESLLLPKGGFVESGLCDSLACPSMCLLDESSKAVCGCPRGFSSSGGGCVEGPWCRSWELDCGDPKRTCVHKRLRCDGTRDCPSGADESNCSCPGRRSWQCASGGGCVAASAYCDGRRDCADGSDEAGCRCASPGQSYDCSWGWTLAEAAEARLEAGACIHRDGLCNRHPNCHAHADEEDAWCSLGRPLDRTTAPGASASSFEILFLLPIGVSLLFVLLACILFAVIFYHKKTQNAAVPHLPHETIPLNTSVQTSTPLGTMSTNVEVRVTARLDGTLSHFDSHSFLRPTFTSTPFQPEGSSQTLPYNRSRLTGKSSSSLMSETCLQCPEGPPPSLAWQTLPTRGPRRTAARGRRRSGGRSRPRVRLPPPPPPYSELGLAPPPSPATTAAEWEEEPPPRRKRKTKEHWMPNSRPRLVDKESPESEYVPFQTASDYANPPPSPNNVSSES